MSEYGEGEPEEARTGVAGAGFNPEGGFKMARSVQMELAGLEEAVGEPGHS